MRKNNITPFKYYLEWWLSYLEDQFSQSIQLWDFFDSLIFGLNILIFIILQTLVYKPGVISCRFKSTVIL
jgi:hypothetical protein